MTVMLLSRQTFVNSRMDLDVLTGGRDEWVTKSQGNATYDVTHE